jgi:hypothetical protein
MSDVPEKLIGKHQDKVHKHSWRRLWMRIPHFRNTHENVRLHENSNNKQRGLTAISDTEIYTDIKDSELQNFMSP